MSAPQCVCRLIALLVVLTRFSTAAEIHRLDESNFDALAPSGKEVDCIYGDYVLQNDRIRAVIGDPIPMRKANMTVRNVGGAVIDLAVRGHGRDQLSCYYPLGGDYRLKGPIPCPSILNAPESAASLAFDVEALNPEASGLKGLKSSVTYQLTDGQDYLTVLTVLENGQDEKVTVSLADGIRADGEFQFGHDPGLNLSWCYDEYWHGAYGLTSEMFRVQSGPADKRRPWTIQYNQFDANAVEIPGREYVILSRQLIVGPSTLDVFAVARELKGEEVVPVTVVVEDEVAPVEAATVEAFVGDQSVGKARTNQNGAVKTRLAPGKYTFRATAPAHEPSHVSAVVPRGASQITVRLGGPPPGFLSGQITDDAGAAIACKVAFHGEGVNDPNFGPDSAVHGVRNLWYTPDGQFRVTLAPGKYRVVMSHGPEYDVVVDHVEIKSGETAKTQATLVRTVDTTGWLSAELHSHSSPSGDNTSSQRGRVLNLLAEHLEFIPCTEHQRVSTYREHLVFFDAMQRVLTCTGMELTGTPLSINHQNAFPLDHHPRTQDGGAPAIDANPVVQIARLAMWNNARDKVVQINHPNLAQMVGDADRDNVPDNGFRQMFHHTDVIEVHPPEMIFDDLAVNEKGWEGRGTVIQNWMQLLNLGYRIPGVVNTDAHWNYHGSGWLRNYVRSSTDKPAEADLVEICHAIERGQVVMTNGPFLSVEAISNGNRVGPGEDLRTTTGRVTLAVRVECANWLDVNRVQVFVNGRADERFRFTRRESPDRFADATTKFNQQIEIPLQKDAHLIVAAAGEGFDLTHVYGPDNGKSMPVAVANPIFVDTDGAGFQPNGDMLDVPLPVEPDHRFSRQPQRETERSQL